MTTDSHLENCIKTAVGKFRESAAFKLFERSSIGKKVLNSAVFKQFIKFGFVGLSNTAISLGIYYIFVIINQDLYLVGSAVGFFISVLNAYYWNNKYVFQKTQKGNAKPLLKSYLSYGSTFFLDLGLKYVMVQLIGISAFIAPLISLCVTIPVNFVLNKLWAFK